MSAAGFFCGSDGGHYLGSPGGFRDCETSGASLLVGGTFQVEADGPIHRYAEAKDGEDIVGVPLTASNNDVSIRVIAVDNATGDRFLHLTTNNPNFDLLPERRDPAGTLASGPVPEGVVAMNTSNQARWVYEPPTNGPLLLSYSPVARKLMVAVADDIFGGGPTLITTLSTDDGAEDPFLTVPQRVLGLRASQNEEAVYVHLEGAGLRKYSLTGQLLWTLSFGNVEDRLIQSGDIDEVNGLYYHPAGERAPNWPDPIPDYDLNSTFPPDVPGFVIARAYRLSDGQPAGIEWAIDVPWVRTDTVFVGEEGESATGDFHQHTIEAIGYAPHKLVADPVRGGFFYRAGNIVITQSTVSGTTIQAWVGRFYITGLANADGTFANHYRNQNAGNVNASSVPDLWTAGIERYRFSRDLRYPFYLYKFGSYWRIIRYDGSPAEEEVVDGAFIPLVTVFPDPGVSPRTAAVYEFVTATLPPPPPSA
ncbi:MAG: hypothetical protein AAF333_13395 [Planctomycetota bacterium]